MAKIPESSKVTFYSGVDITQGLEVIFSSRESQEAYFNSKIFTTAASNKNFSYLRRGGSMKCGITAAEAAKCDYISFINPAFENRRFYAKLVDYQYVNNRTTLITYAIDYFQSYMFDVVYDQGTIEREHLSEADYQLSVLDPWRRDVYGLLTGEDLQVSPDMEELYQSGSYDGLQDPKGFAITANYPYESAASNVDLRTAIILEISDFDTADLDMDPFYYNFNAIIGSDGTVKRWAPAEGMNTRNAPAISPAPIGRGYGIYEIDAPNSGGNLDPTAAHNLALALNWLTYNGFSQSIIGIYQIAWEAWASYVWANNAYGTRIFTVHPILYNVHNKKLLRFPFQYVRLFNNGGDTAEFQYEHFKDRITHDQTSGAVYVDAKFQYAATLDGIPAVYALPINYKMEGINAEQRMEYNQIPQVGYTTDSYLAFLASKYTENIGNRTLNRTEINRDIAYGTEMYGTQPGEFDLPGQYARINALVSEWANLFKNSMTGEGENDLNSSTWLEATAWKNGGNVADSTRFAPAKRAYAADEYHAGNISGFLGYYLAVNNPGDMIDNRKTPGTFTICRVKLQDEVLKVFDDYLSGYGYTSGRLGKPNVCSYIEGDTENAPHFAPYFGKSVTYVKTSGMHVIHSSQTVAQAIEQMFDSGVQFLKGEDL